MNSDPEIAGKSPESLPATAEELVPEVYDELRRLARFRMAQEAPGHTLQPTALVHEAWLRLNQDGKCAGFDGERHFFAAASEAMRRILVESARRKKRQKHGGDMQRVELDGIELALPMPNDELLALDESLSRLGNVDPRAARVVSLCFFGGLSREHAALQMGVSLSTAERLWAWARAWLYREMKRLRQAPP